jgi:chemotaxis protein methyltransferase CheR
MDLLLEGLYRRYGADFAGYAPRVLRRRVQRRLVAERIGTLSALQERLLRDPVCFARLALDLSITVTAMFRDPGFYRAFRERVVPLLRSYPSVRIWHAGCASGEEVLSLAIVLREEGLYERTRIYATDINEAALEQARTGEFALSKMSDYTRNYLRSGGKAAFSDYYRAVAGSARFDAALTDNVVFAQHNLVADGAFNEFNVIVCRNVLIYFGRELQQRVFGLFDASLSRRGVIALGVRDPLERGDYEQLDPVHNLFRRTC